MKCPRSFARTKREGVGREKVVTVTGGRRWLPLREGWEGRTWLPLRGGEGGYRYGREKVVTVTGGVGKEKMVTVTGGVGREKVVTVTGGRSHSNNKVNVYYGLLRCFCLFVCLLFLSFHSKTQQAKVA